MIHLHVFPQLASHLQPPSSSSPWQIVHTHTHTYLYFCAYIHTYTHTHTLISTASVTSSASFFSSMANRTYTHTRTHTHTYIHTHIFLQLPSHLQPPASSPWQISSLIIDLQPEGTTFTVPVTLSLSVTGGQTPASPDSTLAVFLFDKRIVNGKPMGWRIISPPQAGQTTTVTALINHFSTYAVMRAIDPRRPVAPISPPIPPIVNQSQQPDIDTGVRPPGVGDANGGGDDKSKLEDAQRHERTLGLALGLALGLPIVALVAAGEAQLRAHVHVCPCARMHTCTYAHVHRYDVFAADTNICMYIFTHALV
jgi:hypothetical protein